MKKNTDLLQRAKVVYEDCKRHYQESRKLLQEVIDNEAERILLEADEGHGYVVKDYFGRGSATPIFRFWANTNYAPEEVEDDDFLQSHGYIEILCNENDKETIFTSASNIWVNTKYGEHKQVITEPLVEL